MFRVVAALRRPAAAAAAASASAAACATYYSSSQLDSAPTYGLDPNNWKPLTLSKVTKILVGNICHFCTKSLSRMGSMFLVMFFVVGSAANC